MERYGMSCFNVNERNLPLLGDVRNDIYVTLVQGEFDKGSKTTPKKCGGDHVGVRRGRQEAGGTTINRRNTHSLLLL